MQGATLNFELLGRHGEVLAYQEAGERLGEAGFHLRTGCTCNPGACYNATGGHPTAAASGACCRFRIASGWLQTQCACDRTVHIYPDFEIDLHRLHPVGTGYEV